MLRAWSLATIARTNRCSRRPRANLRSTSDGMSGLRRAIRLPTRVKSHRFWSTRWARREVRHLKWRIPSGSKQLSAFSSRQRKQQTRLTAVLAISAVLQSESAAVRFGDLPAQHQSDAGAAGFGGEERHEQIGSAGQTGAFIPDI